jgi:hypothetical protein
VSNARFELWHQGPPYEAWGVARIDRHNEGSRSTRGFGNDILAALEYFAMVLLGPRCVECKDPIKFGEWMPSVQAEVDTKQVCHTCLFWRKRLAEHGPHVAIVNGERFSISPDKPRGYQGFIGHGGAEFRIRFHDGREVVTRNLWAQGRVPDHFRDRLPDNATFVQRGHRNIGPFAGYGGAGSADSAVCDG